MGLKPTSIKFSDPQREWLQAEANRTHNGRIGTMIKAWVEVKRLGIKRAKPERKVNA